MRFLTAAIVIASLLAGFAVSGAQTKPKTQTKPKPAQKPPVKPQVKGTTQLPGDNGQIGTTYTMGTGSEAINFTLTSAEFTVEPMQWSDLVVSGNGETKLLVLKGTYHNPNKELMRVSHDSLNFTLVHADDQNYEPRAVIHAHNKSLLGMDLKPAQKVEVVVIIPLPAKGEAPKLMVAHWREGNKVLRYDIRGKVKALPDPFRDPAVATGADLRSTIPGVLGTPYSMGILQVTAEKIDYVTTALGDFDPGEEEQFAVITATVTNNTPLKREINHGWIEGSADAADGGKAESRAVLMGGRDANFDNRELAPGESVKIRVLFQIPRSTKVEKFSLSSFDLDFKPSAKFVYTVK